MVSTRAQEKKKMEAAVKKAEEDERMGEIWHEMSDYERQMFVRKRKREGMTDAELMDDIEKEEDLRDEVFRPRFSIKKLVCLHSLDL